MTWVHRCMVGFAALTATLGTVGCSDSNRQVEETAEYSFDDMAAMAAEETKLSEVEE